MNVLVYLCKPHITVSVLLFLKIALIKQCNTIGGCFSGSLYIYIPGAREGNTSYENYCGLVARKRVRGSFKGLTYMHRLAITL